MAYQIEPFQGSDLSISLSIDLYLWLLILNPSDSLSAANLPQPDLNGALFAAAKRRQKSGRGRRKKLPKTN